ncbi:unnamed protein product [Aphanomyces euteiches]|nr:hypothetical protein Ae201684P_011996 [Aphanomyces euteiches]
MARTSAISDEVWANAIRAVMVDKMSLRAAAHKFGVHHMSLHRRIKDIRGDVKPKSRQAAAHPAPQQAYAAAPMQSGMSMVNMMHMNMDREAKQPYVPLRHMPYEAKPAVLRPFPGIENAAGHNISNVDKAVEAVESGQLDMMQAAVAFKLDANELYDHLRRRHAGDEYLRPADESGLLKVVIARAELGVKMTYDEVVDLIRRVLYRYGQTSGATLNHIVSVFFRRNDNVLRTALEAAMQQEDMGYKYAQAQRPAAMLPPPKGFAEQQTERARPASFMQDARGRYSPSSNLLIASNKITVDKQQQQQPSELYSESDASSKPSKGGNEQDSVVEV